MFSKKSNSQTKRLLSFIIACFFRSTNTIQSFREVKCLNRLILRNFYYTHQDFIAARQKNLELDFDYNLFFKLFSSIILSQFFRKFTFDFLSDTNLFDLKTRELSSISFKQSFSSSLSSFHHVWRRYQNDFFIRNNAIERFFRVSNMTEKMRDQLIFMNFWHYVEIENVESIDSVSNTVVSISIVSVIFEKLRKIKINNFKTVTIMKNRLKCNDKNLLKNEINAKNAWKILKNSFNSFESKMLNDLLIKLWIIIFVNNQNITNYVRRFKMTMQNIRRMIINVLINDNFFILYFHLNLDAKFEQYREHYV